MKKRYLLGLIIGWLLFSTLIDHFLLRANALWYTRLIALENGKFVFDPFERSFSQISFTSFILVPFFLAIVAIVVSAIRSKSDRSETVKSVGTLFYSLGLAILAIILGHVIYRLLSGIDWGPVKVVTNFCDGYALEGKLYLFNLFIAELRKGFGIGALVGIVVGIYIYYNQGVLKVIAEKAGLDLK